MSNTQYDNDATTWSPQGRLLQVEYACEAIKQGSVSVGLRNKEHCVLVAIKVPSQVSLMTCSCKALLILVMLAVA